MIADAFIYVLLSVLKIESTKTTSLGTRVQVSGLTKLKMERTKTSVLFRLKISAGVLTGILGGGIYAVFGWLETPEIRGLHFNDQIVLSWKINCVILCTTPFIENRKTITLLFSILYGLFLGFITEFGFKNVSSPDGMLPLFAALLLTGTLLNLWMAINYKLASKILLFLFSGLGSGILMIVAHMPYEYIFTYEFDSYNNFVSAVVVWATIVWVLMPIYVVIPASLATFFNRRNKCESL
jgi:hypothetical protein